MADIYHVWRRSDGHVGASATSQAQWQKFYLFNNEPEGRHGSIDGVPVTFEHLMTTDYWPEAGRRILKKRGVDDDE
jgi:hypothetical protein